MIRICIAFIFIAVGVSDLIGGEPLHEIEALITTYEDSVRANTLKMIEAKTEQEKAKYRASVPSVAPYAPKVLAIVQSHPNDPEVVRGVTWLSIQAASTPEGQQAIDLLGTQYASASGIAAAIRRLEYQPLERAEPILTRILEANSNEEEQAAAAFALGMIHFRRSARFPDSSAEASRYFQLVVSQFPATQINGFTLADQASQMLFEMTHLAEGGEAPEIEGQDSEGVSFKLSDYRGKHIVLCFWGGWCHACHGVLPILNQLRTQLSDAPMEILGVNTDAGDEGPKALAKFDVKFRNWMDQTTSGPITTLYNLRNFPTLYLIDDQGIILKRNPSVADIETHLASLK